jgi:hypothetical protein
MPLPCGWEISRKKVMAMGQTHAPKAPIFSPSFSLPAAGGQVLDF